MKNLRIIKLNGLSKMSDHSLSKLAASSEVLEHLELTRCESLSDYSIGTIIRQTPTLKFIDLNAIPAITPKVLEELKNIKPDLLIRRYLY